MRKIVAQLKLSVSVRGSEMNLLEQNFLVVLIAKGGLILRHFDTRLSHDLALLADFCDDDGREAQELAEEPLPAPIQVTSSLRTVTERSDRPWGKFT
jgi:hypothetical protein